MIGLLIEGCLGYLRDETTDSGFWLIAVPISFVSVTCFRRSDSLLRGEIPTPVSIFSASGLAL
jgi:hypothetical protein